MVPILALALKEAGKEVEKYTLLRCYKKTDMQNGNIGSKFISFIKLS